MRTRRGIGAAALALAAGAAAARDGPSFDCAKAEGTVETLICGDAALAAKDRRLAAVWAEAVATAEGLDAPPDMDRMRAEQRGWIEGRNDCWKAADVAGCVGDLYDRRTTELQAFWMLAERTALTAYVCEGDRANEFHAGFYATEPPSVRVERGDSVKVGVAVPAASGVRYAMPFGAELWVKGGLATLAWTEGEALDCEAAE